MKTESKVQGMVRLAQGLFFLDAAVWLVFGVASLVWGIRGAGGWRLLLAGLMLCNSAVLAWLGVILGSRKKSAFFVAILYMAVNVVLSIADQVGWIDLMIFVLSLVLLGLLVVTRIRLNQAAGASDQVFGDG
jgi:hypothetical protein